MRICVTGATGFIGEYFCEHFAANGHEVVGIDLVKPRADLPLTRFVHGDIRDEGAMKLALDGCSRVLGLAAAHHDFGIERQTYFDVNEGASRLLGDLCDRAGIREVCWYSSAAIYGDCPKPRNEQGVPAPTHPYGQSKLAGEKVWRAWAARGDGRSMLCIRPTITFGPRNWANMFSLIRQIEQRKFFIAGPGTNFKSLSYVENLVSSTLHLWGTPRPGFEVFNWVEKPDLNSTQIAHAVAKALGRSSPGPRLPYGLVRVAALPFDAVIAMTGWNLPVSGMRVKKLFKDETLFESSKARAAGCAPAITTEEGIRRMVEWYLSEGKHSEVRWRQPPAPVQTFAD